jgi:hypothetical protein
MDQGEEQESACLRPGSGRDVLMPAIPPEQAAAMLQDLYGSEINFTISAFWDAGFDWKLGDEANGYEAKGRAGSFAEAVEQLGSAAIKHFDKSDFAGKYRRAK